MQIRCNETIGKAAKRGETSMVTTEQELLSALSEKQREALDLLIKHMTSKEISRTLGISPHTVDQRIETAKKKLGAASRSELAQKYQNLLSLCQRLTYEDSHMATPVPTLQEQDRTDPELLLIRNKPTEIFEFPPEWRENDFRVVPKLFEGRWGGLARLGAIAAIAFLIVASVLGGIAIFQVLSALIA